MLVVDNRQVEHHRGHLSEKVGNVALKVAARYEESCALG